MRPLCLGIGEGLVARYECTIALPPRPRVGGFGAAFALTKTFSFVLVRWLNVRLNIGFLAVIL